MSKFDTQGDAGGEFRKPGATQPSPTGALRGAWEVVDSRPEEPLDRRLARVDRTDIGNGVRMVTRHGAGLIWVEEIGWLNWDGRRWRADGAESIARVCAHQTAEAIKAETLALLEAVRVPPQPEPPVDKEVQKTWEREKSRRFAPVEEHREWAQQSQNKGRLDGMMHEARSYLRQEVGELDAKPYLLNVENGTVDLAGGMALKPHDASDLVTRLAPVVYDLEAECPRWQRFVADVLPDLPGQEGTARFVQKWLGLCLSADISEQKIVVFEGKGANGKSTLLEVVARILGDYAQVTPIETFLHQERRSGSGPSPDIARLPGARLVRASEPEPGARLSESTIKQWTGGERMVARHLHRGFFEFTPQGKLTLSVNIRPVLVGKDHGIRRRILVVPFTQTFKAGGGAPRGKTLADELMEEASGILNWLLEGFALWREEGLDPPPAVAAATESYFVEMDPVGAFVAEAGERSSAGLERTTRTRRTRRRSADGSQTSGSRRRGAGATIAIVTGSGRSGAHLISQSTIHPPHPIAGMIHARNVRRRAMLTHTNLGVLRRQDGSPDLRMPPA